MRISECDGDRATFKLEPMTVAAFYERTMYELSTLGIVVNINRKPNEIVDAIPFDRDKTHRTYVKEDAERFWRVLLQANRLCKEFRAGFLGKASPVQFFWGSFDLAATRYSGRSAPPHPGGIPNLPDAVTREAYSHEEHSVGFWPGGNGVDAAFYAYAYPEPPGFAEARIAPAAAGWNVAMREFVLPYGAVREASDPDRAVLSFFESTYEAAANLAKWDRAALERT
jgi:hypothetical protein